MNDTKPAVGSLFSGIGGLDLGLERAGWDVRWQVEVNPYRRGILARHWPDVERHSDITEVQAEALESVDLVCGGFPCQDLSVAGKRAGLKGHRSGLFWEIIRILAGIAIRPRWLLLENVPGLFSSCACRGCHKLGVLLQWHRRRRCPGCAGCRSAKSVRQSHKGTDFAVVSAALGQLGYHLAYRVVDSQYFGLAQRRQRVFIVGHFGGPCPPEILFESTSLRRDSPPSRHAGENVAGTLAPGAHPSGFNGNDAASGNVAYGLTAADGDVSAIKGSSIGRKPEAGPQRGETRTDGTMYTLDTQEPHAVAYGPSNHRGGRDWHEIERARALNTGGGVGAASALVGETPIADRVREAPGVPRRLDPDTPDSPRYAALGDAVSVPVAHWIGKRILRAHFGAPPF